jgi:hypothetical protein
VGFHRSIPEHLPRQVSYPCFFSESRLQFINATNLNRKSGGA